MMALLEAESLHASYRNANGNEVLRGVGLSMDAGQALLIHGHNGSGKSTLLKVLAGIIPATSGTVSWHGRAYRCPTRWSPCRPWIGFQMQSRNVFDGLNVRSNIGLAAAGKGLRAGRCEESVQDHFPLLRPLLDKRAGLLSGGQRRVLALAIATLGDPPVLLLDEPMAGLSGDSTTAVLACLAARKAAGAILIIVEHSMSRLDNGLIDLHAEMVEGKLSVPVTHRRVPIAKGRQQ